MLIGRFVGAFERLQLTKWLHISDLHFKSGEPYDRNVVLNALVNSLDGLVARVGQPDLLFVTGDLAHSGRHDEYEEVTSFFDRITNKLKISREHVFVVPGNHDVNREGGVGLARQLSGEEADRYFGSSSPLPHISGRQSEFVAWYDSYFSGVRSFPQNNTVDSLKRITLAHQVIDVLQVNTAIFCIDDEDEHKLRVGRRSLDGIAQKLEASNADLKVVLMHHPFEWLANDEAQQVRNSLRSAADIILSGHLHTIESEAVSGTFGQTVHLAAGACYQTRRWPNTATFGEFAGASVRVTPIRYVDAPRERWVIDTAIYPDAHDFVGTLPITRVAAGITSGPQLAETREVITVSGKTNGAHEAWIGDLFEDPSGKPLYAEPRLAQKPQIFSTEELPPETITVAQIVSSNVNYSIEVRSEFGGTNLSNRLGYEISNSGKNVVIRDARHIPNYRKKLEIDFQEELTDGENVIILDNFDIDKDEKLIKELHQGAWFSRLILITINRGIHPNRVIDSKSLPYKFEPLYVWGLGREAIRSLAEQIFDTHDSVFVNPIVDKVYADLLGLCIPLSPSNVVMYLRILHREGEYYPLNRVDIVGRYLDELLRSPSDAYAASFSAKNKFDVISAFAYSMFKEEKTSFDKSYWFSFVGSYQRDTLTDFDGDALLQDIEDARIVINVSNVYYFKYQFFYSFYLGRFLASHPAELETCLNFEEYTRIRGLVDVITGLSSNNVAIITKLSERLEDQVKSFSSNYVDENFDPLAASIWPDNQALEERLWTDVNKAIEAGPNSEKQIDELKTSFVAESRTAHQEVIFTNFVDLENALFHSGNMLTDALRNSDDVPGPVKIRAFRAVLKSHLAAFQVGVLFASILAKRSFFRWGSIAFIDFDKAAASLDPNSDEAKMEVVISLSRAVARRAASDLGSRKLSGVFRAEVAVEELTGFSEAMNFSCILAARGTGWIDSATQIIERVGRQSFYLWFMLEDAMDHLQNDIVQHKDREGLKKLVATVQAKRHLKKDKPGAKAVTRVLERLEKSQNL